MGLNQEPLWEVQWHPARGGKPRRLVLTRGGLRRLLAVLGLVALAVLGVLGIIPLGLRTVFSGFTLAEAKRQNSSLNIEHDSMREKGDLLARTISARLDRGRRLAWMLGMTVTGGGEADTLVPPAAGATDDELASWLDSRSGDLDALAHALSSTAPRTPCPMASLPSGTPLDMREAVPVAPFGWRISPFTGKREAHHGTTLAAPERARVLATGAGTVFWAGAVRERRTNEWTRFGTIVIVDHGAGVVSVFGHLHDAAVKRGQQVKRGQLLGTVGQTGWTRVPALYYEVRWPLGGASRPIDPAMLCLALPLDDPAARRADPTGGLPDDYALLEHLRKS